MIRKISELLSEKLGYVPRGKQYEASGGQGQYFSINTPNTQRGWIELT